jgi:hypothetical protein
MPFPLRPPAGLPSGAGTGNRSSLIREAILSKLKAASGAPTPGNAMGPQMLPPGGPPLGTPPIPSLAPSVGHSAQPGLSRSLPPGLPPPGLRKPLFGRR